MEVKAENEGLYYTTVDGFISWFSSNLSGILSNDTPNEYEPDRDKIAEALLHSESFVDSFLETGSYNVPIKNKRAVSLIKIWCYYIASHELYSRRGMSQEAYYKYSQIIRSLEKISEGRLKLIGELSKISSEGGILSGSTFQSPFSNPLDYKNEGYVI